MDAKGNYHITLKHQRSILDFENELCTTETEKLTKAIKNMTKHTPQRVAFADDSKK